MAYRMLLGSRRCTPVLLIGDPPLSLNLRVGMLLGSRRSVAAVPVGRSAAAGLVLKPTSGRWSRGAAAELLSAPKPVISPQRVNNK